MRAKFCSAGRHPESAAGCPIGWISYDDGYEGRYAEADAYKALDELRADGVACLCLSIGAVTGTDALAAASALAGHASATTLADLSPRMDELFLSSLARTRRTKPQRG